MPNPLLKRYFLGVIAATTWTSAMGAVVGANRALVAKVVVVNTTAAAVTFSLGIAAAVGNGGKFADSITLNPGEVYTETGLVVAAGEQLNAWSSVANAIGVTVTGEEVDNL